VHRLARVGTLASDHADRDHEDYRCHLDIFSIWPNLFNPAPLAFPPVLPSTMFAWNSAFPPTQMLIRLIRAIACAPDAALRLHSEVRRNPWVPKLTYVNDCPSAPLVCAADNQFARRVQWQASRRVSSEEVPHAKPNQYRRGAQPSDHPRDR
jgi:hypothetical protein